MAIRSSGRTFWRAESCSSVLQADSFVPPITSETLFSALAREVRYLRQEIVEKLDSEWRDVPKYRVYAVLTLCRSLYSHTHGTVVSKPKAAEWALSALPDRWHAVIAEALAANAGGSADSLDLNTIARFIEFTGARVHVTGSDQGASPVTS